MRLIQGEKILGSMVILYFQNDLIQHLEQFMWKKLGWSVTWIDAVQIFSTNGTQAKIQAIKRFQETLPRIPLFQLLWNNFQCQLLRSKANWLSGGCPQEIKNNWKLQQASLQVVAYESWWFMRGSIHCDLTWKLLGF